MTIYIDDVKPGDVLYQTYTYGMGNTKSRGQGVYRYRVASVSLEREYGVTMPHVVLDNGKKLYGSDVRKCRRSAPEWLKQGWFESICGDCGAKRSEGHRDHCPHPRAVRAREKAAKAAALEAAR